MDASKKDKSDNLVSIETAALKDRLNQVYRSNRSALQAHNPVFDSLWDLKEKAILEKRSTVEVPDSWLSEIDENHTGRSMGS